MPTIALTNLPDGAAITAALHRNNYAAIQAILNGLDGDNFGAGALAGTHIFRAKVVGDADNRLVIFADGSLIFGGGAAVGDTSLFRSGADQLKTDDGFTVGGNGLKVGAFIGGGSIAGAYMALANITATPGSNPVGGGFLYAQAGALKWFGSSGTLTTIAPA